jgi:hypothetical protein
VIAVGLGAVLRAQAQTAPNPFREKTSRADSLYANVRARVVDIDKLREDAARSQQALRLSCIEEKLTRARANEAAAKVVMDGWSVGATSAEYADRSLDRLSLLSVYAMVYADEARTCSEVRALGQSLEVKVDKALPHEALPDVWRRPNLERPPLASPY